ncbi:MULTISPECIES: hypothetical protein [Oligella]|uniref:Uncharacterized protein n=2 Tax=Oligella TaxID=90243 RepID=A0A095YN65_9BURK|nr:MULTISPECIES: hypothetical protein [Oligella]KGF23870.1 hypothetical protein HMPREF2130_11865 [Oligella urethralis DNF00040]OFS87672.1 hypothetical protein HMPREF3144_03650 [Oligella sp. HMSC05A10]OFV50646.1 hypothetical protein HMPREF3179_02340 [Oligella sp. HMSC09E12]QPT40983.1 hypothetical protein I6G29_05400 [Oligella ureolytica]SUA53378.1 Uncharacterised protein [Oligella ureolytica]
MKINDKEDGENIEVFGIYWGEVFRSAGKIEYVTYFLGLPRDNGGWLMIYDSREVEIVDSVLKGQWTFFPNRYNGLYYAPLIQEKLLDDVMGREPEAIEKFIQFAKQDGLLETGFY